MLDILGDNAGNATLDIHRRYRVRGGDNAEKDEIAEKSVAPLRTKSCFSTSSLLPPCCLFSSPSFDLDRTRACPVSEPIAIW